MSAARYNFVIEQSATFNYVLTYYSDEAQTTPVNLTGYTARMSIKLKVGDVDTIISLTTENGRITLGGALGTITLLITATDTSDLDFKEAVYDLELESGTGTVIRLLQGSVILEPAVTT